MPLLDLLLLWLPEPGPALGQRLCRARPALCALTHRCHTWARLGLGREPALLFSVL